MPACANGHDSATADYCDVCGIPMGAQAGRHSSPDPPLPPAASPDELGPPCPDCGTPQTGRFCEVDGYDFLAATLNPGGGLAPDPDPVPVPAPPPVPAAVPSPGTGPTPAGSWLAVAGADRTYFEAVRTLGGEDAAGLAFPPFCPERRFALRGPQMLIGRRSRSRGIEPEIDLTGPPEDPGVSHVHALLVAQPDGGWALVDLDSANGTYLNDSPDPLQSNQAVPVGDGDRIHVGAWTTLTLYDRR